MKVRRHMTKSVVEVLVNNPAISACELQRIIGGRRQRVLKALARLTRSGWVTVGTSVLLARDGKMRRHSVYSVVRARQEAGSRPPQPGS